MGFQTRVAQVNDFRQTLSSGSLNTLRQGLFKFLTHDVKTLSSNDKKVLIDDLKESERDEIRSLKHLEDCANATRGTEAYDQYEWLNDADE